MDKTNNFTSQSQDQKPPSWHLNQDMADNLPAEMVAIPRWVVWRWDWRTDRWTKPPVNPKNGHYTDATDPHAWMPFNEAACKSVEMGDGVGFALGTNGPFVGVDLDHVLDVRNGQLIVTPQAQEVIDFLDSYTEITPSRTGLRTWVYGRLPRDKMGMTRNRTKDAPWFEVYDSDRYFTITGYPLKHPVKPVERWFLGRKED